MPYVFSRSIKSKKNLISQHDKVARAAKERVQKEQEKVSDALAKFQNGYRRERSKLLGDVEDKIAEFDRQRREVELAARGRKRGTIVPIDPVRISHSRRKLSLKWARDVGLDVKRLKGLNAQWQLRLWKLFDEIDLRRPIKHLFDMHTPADEATWVSYQPPYAGAQWGWEHWGDNFSFGMNRVVDPNAGFVRNEISMDNPSASDSDLGNIRHDTQLVVWHTTKGTGPLEILIHGQVNQASVELVTIDEFGWSDSVTAFSNSIMAHVIHPNTDSVLLADMGEVRLEADETMRRAYQTLPNFSIHAVLLTTNGSIAKGETVAVRFGCRSRMGAHSNDIEMHHKTNHAWFFHKVEIRTKLP